MDQYYEMGLEERLLAQSEPEPNTGCWLWTGPILPHGYGMIRVGGRKRKRVHRVAWEVHHGAIPDGLCVLHKCDVRCCVNPAHLFLGTVKDNVWDMIDKGRGNMQTGTYRRG